jgi:hypothetical protein
MNFNSPFKASSIVEFWARWHITLTRFLTAYIYTPIVLHLTRTRMIKGKPLLRGKRSTLSAIAILVGLPTFITMTISGFWHGAGWQFIVWGVLHGTYLTINQSWRLLRPRFWPDQVGYERVMKPVGFVLTFGSVVIALVFFRATSVDSALSILGGMAGMNGVLPNDVQALENLGVNVSWDILKLWKPIAPFFWVLVLFLAVTLLPNSLELLRRFRPALDFPEELEEALDPQVSASGTVRQPTGGKRLPAAAKLRVAWAAVGRLGHEGIYLSPLTATLVALLLVLGVIALNTGGAFLYGQF